MYQYKVQNNVKLPSQLPELIKVYKQKNQLNNSELINRINDEIPKDKDKIVLKKDVFNHEVVPSAFYDMLSDIKRARPRNIEQRKAIMDVLGVDYIETIFKNGDEIIQYLSIVYDYEVTKLDKIKDTYFDDKSILTTELLAQKISDSTQSGLYPLSKFIFHFYNFLIGLNKSLSLCYELFGFIAKGEVADSLYELQFNLYLLMLKAKHHLKFEDIQKEVKTDDEIIAKGVSDLINYKDAFFSTFGIVKLNFHNGQYTDNFDNKNLYNNLNSKINSIFNLPNEKKGVMDRSIELMCELFDELGVSLFTHPFISIRRI